MTVVNEAADDVMNPLLGDSRRQSSESVHHHPRCFGTGELSEVTCGPPRHGGARLARACPRQRNLRMAGIRPRPLQARAGSGGPAAYVLPETVINTSRFRPSIVIEAASTPNSAQPFIENEWTQKTLTIGDATTAVSLCAPRCIMTTIAQPGLPQAKEILHALASHNRLFFDGFGHFACLGVYAEVTSGGTVRVGDPVTMS